MATPHWTAFNIKSWQGRLKSGWLGGRYCMVGVTEAHIWLEVTFMRGLRSRQLGLGDWVRGGLDWG